MTETETLKKQIKQLQGDCKSFNQDVQKLTEENLKLRTMKQTPNILDRLDLSIIKHESDLKACYEELNNENLTEGENRSVHVEIEKLNFSLKTLKFIKL